MQCNTPRIWENAEREETPWKKAYDYEQLMLEDFFAA